MVLIASLNADPLVPGILVQLPLPKHIDAGTICATIDPRKDVDGLYPDNIGSLALKRPLLLSLLALWLHEISGRDASRSGGQARVVIGDSQSRRPSDGPLVVDGALHGDHLRSSGADPAAAMHVASVLETGI